MALVSWHSYSASSSGMPVLPALDAHSHHLTYTHSVLPAGSREHHRTTTRPLSYLTTGTGGADDRLPAFRTPPQHRPITASPAYAPYGRATSTGASSSSMMRAARLPKNVP